MTWWFITNYKNLSVWTKLTNKLTWDRCRICDLSIGTQEEHGYRHWPPVTLFSPWLVSRAEMTGGTSGIMARHPPPGPPSDRPSQIPTPLKTRLHFLHTRNCSHTPEIFGCASNSWSPYVTQLTCPYFFATRKTSGEVFLIFAVLLAPVHWTAVHCTDPQYS